MRCLPTIFLSLFAGAASLCAEPTSVELILDCSGSMWNKLNDGRYRIEAAKSVLSDFIATAPDKEELHIGLRLYGSKISHREPGACEDTALVVPVEGFQRAEMLRLVKEARAIGATPLALSLNAAADDLTRPGKKQVIVFTDGEESCDGDVAAALARLKAAGIDADVRIIGIGLPKAVAERFAALAPVENADSAIKLAEALKSATAATVAAPAAPMVAKEKVTVRVTRNGGPLAEGEVSFAAADKAVHKLAKGEEPGVWTAELPPGLYTGTVAPAGRSFPDLGVARGADNTFVLDVTELPKVTVEVPNENITILGEFTALFSGANGVGDQYIIIAPVGAPDNAEPNLRDALGKENTLTIIAPDIPGQYEARFTVRGPDYQQIVCGRSKPFEVKLPEIVLEMPAVVQSNTSFEVKYKAPVQPGDWIGWVRAGAEDGDYVLYGRPSRDSDTLHLASPAEPGDYEIRYANDGSRVPFARKAFKVEGVGLALEGPAEAMAGTRVKIAWKGPKVSSIYMTIVERGAGIGAYNDYERLEHAGNPADLQAPRQAGAMEIRLMNEQENKLLLSRPITLTEMKASVQGPAEAAADTSIPVKWTGPAGTGDYVTIVKAGAADGDYLDYTTITESPADIEIKLPADPGDYELRYVTQESHVLARQPVKVK